MQSVQLCEYFGGDVVVGGSNVARVDWCGCCRDMADGGWRMADGGLAARHPCFGLRLNSDVTPNPPPTQS